MSPGVLSLGDAGVFDGIAMCGLFALLLICSLRSLPFNLTFSKRVRLKLDKMPYE